MNMGMATSEVNSLSLEVYVEEEIRYEVRAFQNNKDKAKQ